MKFNDRRLCSHTALLFALTNIAVFILYYVFSYLFAAPNDLVVYLIKFITRTVDLLLPFVGGAVIITLGAYRGTRKALLAAIPFAAVKIFYLLPYYYLVLIAEGYDSVESLTLGALYSIPELLIYYAVLMLIYTVVVLVHRFVSGRSAQKPALSVSLAEGDIFNLDNGATLGIFAVALCAFLYLLVTEIINTVSYLIEYAGSYQTGEIAYMVISFIYDIGMLLLCHAVACAVKNAVISRRCVSV